MARRATGGREARARGPVGIAEVETPMIRRLAVPVRVAILTFLASALSNYFLRPMRTWERLLFAFSAILMIVPGIISTATGLVLVIPVLLRQVAAMRRSAATA